ncbi:MAG TPA: FecR domain-containing protein, partial [Polyangiaceae bacterium]|nr:FecR domain-containing protein [Polyangiaceae bacterium]
MDDDERDEVLGRLGRVARQAFSDRVTPVASAAGKRQLKVALATVRPKRRAGRWAAVALAALVAVAAVIVDRRLPQPLAYAVEGTTSGASGYLQGSTRAPAVAHFSDGTEVRVSSAARARVVDVDSRGARIALEQGRAHLRVVHRPEARWSVEAGPFSIAVTGTEFDVDWSAVDGVLVVEMRSGSVIVRGPLAGDGIGVHGGQRLVASVPESRLHIEPLARGSAALAGPAEPSAANDGTKRGSGEPEATVAEATANAQPADDVPMRDVHGDVVDALGAPRAAEERGTERSVTLHDAPGRNDAHRTAITERGAQPERAEAKPSQSAERAEGNDPTAEHASAPDRGGNAAQERSAQSLTWAKRVASGDFHGVLADADAKGLSTTLAEAPLGDLVALADA